MALRPTPNAIHGPTTEYDSRYDQRYDQRHDQR